jgi:hypothetical protein
MFAPACCSISARGHALVCGASASAARCGCGARAACLRHAAGSGAAGYGTHHKLAVHLALLRELDDCALGSLFHDLERAMGRLNVAESAHDTSPKRLCHLQHHCELAPCRGVHSGIRQFDHFDVHRERRFAGVAQVPCGNVACITGLVTRATLHSVSNGVQRRAGADSTPGAPAYTGDDPLW